MEDQFDEPMTFDESLIPVHITPITAGEEIGSWGYGVSMYGAAWGHRREVATPSLMADMYRFTSKEEMEDTKVYLHDHGNYQVEQVSVTGFSADIWLDECPSLVFI